MLARENFTIRLFLTFTYFNKRKIDGSFTEKVTLWISLEYSSITSTLPAKRRVIARCQLMIFRGSKDAFKRSVFSITLVRQAATIRLSGAHGVCSCLWVLRSRLQKTKTGHTYRSKQPVLVVLECVDVARIRGVSKRLFDCRGKPPGTLGSDDFSFGTSPHPPQNSSGNCNPAHPLQSLKIIYTRSSLSIDKSAV